MLDAPKLRTATALWADDLGLDLSNLDGDMLIDRIRSALVATPPAEPVVEAANETTVRLWDFANGDYRYPAYRGRAPEGTPTLRGDIKATLDMLAILAAKPAVKGDETVVALPPTREYVDRIVRIFRDRPADDTSAVVLQDYARAMLAALPAAPQQGGE